MLKRMQAVSILLALGIHHPFMIHRSFANVSSASSTNANPGPPSGKGPGSGDDNPFSNGGDYGPGGAFGPGGFGPGLDPHTMVIAHAVLATLAFGLLFPSGSILIRLASFPGVWLVHGIFQGVTYLFFIAGAGIGIWMATHLRMLNHAHPVIGMIVLALLFFQPILGCIHHFAFKRHSRRGFWSYAHIWLGRAAITLGIINGGLGLRLSKRIRRFAPTQGAIIAYAVIAGFMWLIWMLSAVYGERKRRVTAVRDPPPYKPVEMDGGGERYA